MVGISFPGITQLFVAKTQPPHLAAITPLSVLDDTYDTLYPGGIFNNGFALGWAKDRQADARPATRAGEGQEWARKRIADGDDDVSRQPGAAAAVGERDARRSRANAFRPRRGVRRARARDLRARHRRARCSSPARGRTRRPAATSPTCSATSRPTSRMKITLMNGLHQDSLGPAVLSQWIEFLDFYVAKKIPSIPPATRAIGVAAPRPHLRQAARRSRPTASPTSPTTRRRCAPTRRSRRCACCSTSAPTRRPMPTFSTTATDVPAARHHRDHVVPRRRRHAHRHRAHRRRRRPVRVRPERVPAHDDDATRRRASRPRTAGSRCPRARRSAT